jgi:hypothetical protein
MLTNSASASHPADIVGPRGISADIVWGVLDDGSQAEGGFSIASAHGVVARGGTAFELALAEDRSGK